MGSLAAPAPLYRLDDKVALVTGAGRGIGAAIAIQLAKCGAKVVVNYVKSSQSAEKVVAEIKSIGTDAVAIQADVSKVPETVRLFDEAVKHFGHLDIVCSNSGVVSFGHLEEVTEDEFDRVFNINTRGQFFVAREAYKHLTVGGRIILMSSNMFHETAKDYLPNSDHLTKEEILNIVANVSPLTRCGYPADVANVVGFLASREAEWVNGKVIGIDGGAA